MPLRRVAARMAVLGDIRVVPAARIAAQAWEEGRITRADLDYALSDLPEAAGMLSAQQCIDALQSDWMPTRLPLLIDTLDNDPARHTRLSWRQAITHQVSQTCAAYFDAHQADWQPSRDQGLYALARHPAARPRHRPADGAARPGPPA